MTRHHLLVLVPFGVEKTQQLFHNRLALVRLAGLGAARGRSQRQGVHLLAHRVDDVVQSFGGRLADSGLVGKQQLTQRRYHYGIHLLGNRPGGVAHVLVVALDVREELFCCRHRCLLLSGSF